MCDDRIKRNWRVPHLVVKRKPSRRYISAQKNVPAFYTAIMQFLRTDRAVLFNETKYTIKLSDSPSSIICNDRIIIDDILLLSNHIPTLLHYFYCVVQVFTKFRLSFKLSKCDFLKDRVVYVGHDLTTNGNCPAASKFSLLQD